MRASLEFQLPEEADDLQASLQCYKSLAVICFMREFLRSKLKYCDLTDEQHAIYEEIQKELYRQIESQGVDVDL